MEVKSEVRKLESVIRVLQKFSQFDTKMQVSTILTLLEIAKGEMKGSDMSTADIEKSIGLLSGTASRNVYYWGEGHKDVRGGHEFITVTLDPVDRRRRSLRLTNKGKAFINQLLQETQLDGSKARE